MRSASDFTLLLLLLHILSPKPRSIFFVIGLCWYAGCESVRLMKEMRITRIKTNCTPHDLTSCSETRASHIKPTRRENNGLLQRQRSEMNGNFCLFLRIGTLEKTIQFFTNWLKWDEFRTWTSVRWLLRMMVHSFRRHELSTVVCNIPNWLIYWVTEQLLGEFPSSFLGSKLILMADIGPLIFILLGQSLGTTYFLQPMP